MNFQIEVESVYQHRCIFVSVEGLLEDIQHASLKKTKRKVVRGKSHQFALKRVPRINQNGKGLTQECSTCGYSEQNAPVRRNSNVEKNEMMQVQKAFIKCKLQKICFSPKVPIQTRRSKSYSASIFWSHLSTIQTYTALTVLPLIEVAKLSPN